MAPRVSMSTVHQALDTLARLVTKHSHKSLAQLQLQLLAAKTRVQECKVQVRAVVLYMKALIW